MRTAEETFLKQYMVEIQEEDLGSVLSEHVRQVHQKLLALPENRLDFAYAPGKWTLRQLVGHILDAHVVFTYRILSIARGEKVGLPGFDENTYAEFWLNKKSVLPMMTSTYLSLSQTTLNMFSFLGPLQLHREGIANDTLVTPFKIYRALVGHERHHLKILDERYLG